MSQKISINKNVKCLFKKEVGFYCVKDPFHALRHMGHTGARKHIFIDLSHLVGEVVINHII